MNNVCFVIQPFDKGKFDKRYQEIIRPAIVECSLEPYRVDEDDSVIIPIESIHNMINKSCLCIAEITTDNPNVWYELGYALALNKSVIMLCSDERNTFYPFDIRHRNILTYKTQSPSDFTELKQKLINRMKLYTPSEGELVSANELSNYEIAVLKIIWSNQNTPYELTPRNSIVEIDKCKDQIINAIRKLIDKKFIEFSYSNENGMMKSYYRITLVGEQWIKIYMSKIE